MVFLIAPNLSHAILGQAKGSIRQMDLENVLQSAFEAVNKGESVLESYFGRVKQIERKHLAGLVTEADKESEFTIAQSLKQSGHDFLFLGEESFQESQSSYLQGRDPVWILDPLDGTTNFVHGFPIFAISLGLYWQGQIVLGIVSAPKMGEHGESYWAIRGKGAFLDNQRLRVRQNVILGDAFLATGFIADFEEQLVEQVDIFNHVVRKARAVRRAGAAAYDLALVARGVFDGYWERGLKPWDSAAGSLLVTEAGGVVQSYRASPYHPLKNTVIAGSLGLVQQIQELIKPVIRADSE